MVATINNHIRLVSDGKVYVRNDRESAIAAFLESLPPIFACNKNCIRLFNVPTDYPSLKEFDNDNSFPGVQTADPNFIWDSANQVSGEKLGFATGFEQTVALNDIEDFAVFLQVFADNAHNALISVYDRITNQKLFEVPPGSLRDGEIAPSTGLTEIQPPYGWQNVRYYSALFGLSSVISQTENFVVVLSFEVQNYVHPNNPPFNPAALSFVADFYHQVRVGNLSAIIPLKRLISNESVVVRSDRNQAINDLVTALFASTSPVTNAVSLTTVPAQYPHLTQYVNDTSFFGLLKVGEPKFIWDSTQPISGDRKGFATGFLWNPGDNSDVIVFLQAFADSALNVRIALYDSNKNVIASLTPPSDLTDGDPNPITGTVFDVKPPFGWQNIRYYANNLLSAFPANDLAAGPYAIVISFEVTNYLMSSGSSTNPAALAFVADIYEIPDLGSIPLPD